MGDGLHMAWWVGLVTVVTLIYVGELVDQVTYEIPGAQMDEHPETHANTSQDGAPPPSDKLLDKAHENSSHNYGLWYL